MNNPAVKCGLIGGVIAFIASFVIWFANYHLLASLWVYAGYFILWTVMAVMAVKAVRRLTGVIDFKNAFMSAFVTLAIASFLSMAGGLIVFQFLDSDGVKKEKLVMKIIENTVDSMKSFGAPANTIDEFLENDAREMPAQFEPVAQVIGWLKGLIFYAVIALIMAAIMKSKREELDNAILDAQQY